MGFHGKYDSKNMGRPKKDPIKRFWSFVDIKSDNECWEWKIGRDKDGYGLFMLDGKQWRAHRYSMFITEGLSVTQPLVCHTCDNPPCVNPKHLVNGTAKFNMVDKIAKGRHPKKYKK